MRHWLESLLSQLGWRFTIGARGERTAARHLRQQGYRILGRNLRSRLGEVDILALDPDGKTVVVVEVKAGTSTRIAPEVHVNRHKQRKLAALAAQLVKRYRLEDRLIRFDVIGVDLPPDGAAVVRHHVGAFESHL